MELEQISKEVRKNILFQVYNAASGHVRGGTFLCRYISSNIF